MKLLRSARRTRRRRGVARATAACWPWPCRKSAGRGAGCASGWPTARCEGRIAAAPRGGGGFGYDPIFEPAAEPPGARTLGEWTAEAKNRISHRGRAARRMHGILTDLGF